MNSMRGTQLSYLISFSFLIKFLLSPTIVVVFSNVRQFSCSEIVKDLHYSSYDYQDVCMFQNLTMKWACWETWNGHVSLSCNRSGAHYFITVLQGIQMHLSSVVENVSV
jgi:hypothetical protein